MFRLNTIDIQSDRSPSVFDSQSVENAPINQGLPIGNQDEEDVGAESVSSLSLASYARNQGLDVSLSPSPTTRARYMGLPRGNPPMRS